MKLFDQIPLKKPHTPLLDLVQLPIQLRSLPETDLLRLADELREYLLYSVGQTGGHFGAGLGVIELTIALHYIFHTPEDRLVWDVGHQAYPHKILTGRRELMSTLRQWGGLAAFPSRTESDYDTFGVGHSSTSISAALGMAIAAKLDNNPRKNIAIIGDGAITAGMAFEALAHAGHEKANMLVVLNDNQMSISENVGGLSNYFARIWASRTYNHLKSSGKKILENHPLARDIAKRTEEHMKGFVSPGTLFEELGFNYIGPINGHDLDELLLYFKKIRALDGPQLLHVVTTKGKGFIPAEKDPIGYHALNKIEASRKVATKKLPDQPKPMKFSNVFGNWLCDMASTDKNLVGITPAMREGSDLVAFSKKYPDRYFDVAIAEQHSITFAAGLACEGKKPVVAIYSTFLQRAYDQLIHDVAIQNLDVLLAVDRAGLVGEDGATHNGSFDLSYLRCIANLIIMAPADENECRQMLYTGYQFNGPAVVRYPRGVGPGAPIQKEMKALEIGKSLTIKQGEHIALLTFGPILHRVKEIATNYGLTLVDMRFVKPLDENLILNLAKNHKLLVSIEENVIPGGAGSGISEFLRSHQIMTPIEHIGLPDSFLGHGNPSRLYQQCGLDKAGIEKRLLQTTEKYAIPLIKRQPNHDSPNNSCTTTLTNEL